MRVASILSIAGHPFVLVPVTVALMVRPARLAIAIATCMVVAMLGVIAWRVASGRWSDYDVSDAQQRHGFYPIALIIVSVTTIVSWLLHMPAGFLRGLFVAIGMLVTAAVLTRFTKVSLHVMIGAFCATILGQADMRAALIMGLLVAAVAWSRVVLRRHTVAQVILGAILGGVFGAMLDMTVGRQAESLPYTLFAMNPRAQELIESLQLEPHPEGGFYRQTFKSPRIVNGNRSAVTAIYFLLPRDQVSRWHRVTSDEIWVHLEGEGVMLHTFDGNAAKSQKLEHFHVVSAGDWQAAEPIGDFALVACFVAPGFEFDDFTMMSDDRDAVARLAAIDTRLTSLV